MEDEQLGSTAETPAEGSAPETNTEETPSESEQQTDAGRETAEEKPAEKSPSRSEKRIKDLIDEKKRAAEEAEYWRQQALQAKQSPHREPFTYEGITEEGIDPDKFVGSIEKRVQQIVEERVQGLTQRQAASEEGRYVSSLPEMKDPIFRSQVVAYAKSGYSPSEAFDIVKQEHAEIQRRVSVMNRARNEAGKFVKEDGATPPAGRSSSGSETYFTREQIGKMSPAEYQKNQEEINRQLQAGLIR